MILGGGIIRSGGNTKIIMIIDILSTWCIRIPLCLLAAYVLKWGIVGVYTMALLSQVSTSYPRMPRNFYKSGYGLFYCAVMHILQRSFFPHS